MRNRNREEILNEVLILDKEIEELHGKIRELYEEAKNIVDPEDDEDGKYSYIECIKSYI